MQVNGWKISFEAIIIVATNLILCGVAWGLLSSSVNSLRADITLIKNTLENKVVQRDENDLWRQRYEERHAEIDKRLSSLERHEPKP